MKKGYGYLLAAAALAALLCSFTELSLRSWLGYGQAERLIRAVGVFIARQEALFVR